jgi:tetratricopeptide (TPR) repeat protein
VISVAGNLESMNLADLLQWCAANIKTGRLRLKRDPIEKTFFFKQGDLFSSTSNSPRETLVQSLLRSHHVTEEELLRAFNAQVRLDMPLGQVLIRLGLITEAALNGLFLSKTMESIFDCFLWPDGDFEFLDGKLPSIAVSTPCDIARVVFEGARRKDEWKRIQEAFRSRYTTFQVEDAGTAADLSETDRQILNLLGEKKNMVDIAFETGMLEFNVAVRLLELHDLGLIRVDETPDGVSYEKQVEILQSFVREGTTLFNATRYREALAAFEKALEIDPQHKYARLLVEKLRNVKDHCTPIEKIPLDSIPVLQVSVDELTTMALDAQEGFVLSRINGEWDIGAIVKLCPMTEQQVLIIVRRLLDDGVIELKEQTPREEQRPDSDFFWESSRHPNRDM